MEIFFNPRAVAVIGASAKNLGNHVVLNLLAGFKGSIYPVNPNYPEIEGLPCFASLYDIADPVDLAIVLVPAEAVPGVLEACAAKHIQRVIIESAGFAETGADGIALQARCLAIAQKAGMRLWGPNCMGVVDLVHRHFFTFMHPAVREEGLLPGRISLIVQSGMMSAIFLSELARRGIGVAKACSIGNRMDVDECDLIEYLQNDPDTDVIALYLESIPRGRRLARLARQSQKPIVLLKGGESQAGAAAAVSHTYSLSGNARLLKSVLALAGVTLAGSIYQMMDMAHALATIPRINPQCRTAILTLSGGAGILACDALEKSGIPIAALSDHTKAELAKVFPPWMPPSNPIDLFPAVAKYGRSEAFRGALLAAMQDPNVDVLVIHFVAGLEASKPDFALLKQMADQVGKVVIFWLMGRKEGSRLFREQARAAGLSVHDDAVRIAECLRAVAQFQAHKAASPAATVNEAAPRPAPAAAVLPAAESVWDEYDSKRLLAQWRIPVTEEKLVGDAREAWQAAQEIGLPVVLKGLAPGKAHKTEHGLVRLGISDRAHLEKDFELLQQRLNGGGRILIQKQVAYDYELIAGFLRDPNFGACVMFGLGGILAELEPDVMFATAPLDQGAALALIRSIRCQRLLNGFRGMTPLDMDAMAGILVRLGDLGDSYRQIAQIDINPLVVAAGRPLAVDANIVLTAAQ